MKSAPNAFEGPFMSQFNNQPINPAQPQGEGKSGETQLYSLTTGGGLFLSKEQV